MFAAVMGPTVRIARVLLTASDSTAHSRLLCRELGYSLAPELAGSTSQATAVSGEPLWAIEYPLLFVAEALGVVDDAEPGGVEGPEGGVGEGGG